MLELAVESICTVSGDGCVFVDYYNVSEENAHRCPPSYRGELIDGFVNIYSPECRAKNEPFQFGGRPFRRVEKGGSDPETGILEWTNPDDPIEDITLTPTCQIDTGGVNCEFWISDGFVVPVRYAEH